MIAIIDPLLSETKESFKNLSIRRNKNIYFSYFRKGM